MKIDMWGVGFAVIALVAAGGVLSQKRTVTDYGPDSPQTAALCERDITKFVPFKDPSSVRVLSTTREKRDGQFTLMVQAKNSFGAYGDATACSCAVAAGVVTNMHCDSASGI